MHIHKQTKQRMSLCGNTVIVNIHKYYQNGMGSVNYAPYTHNHICAHMHTTLSNTCTLTHSLIIKLLMKKHVVILGTIQERERVCV